MIKRPPDIPDVQLLRLLSEGKSTAFEIVYERYWSELYFYATRYLEDPKICEDIVQEVFINFWERSTILEIRNLKAYLFTAVKYRIYNYYQRSVLQLVEDDQLLDLPSEVVSQEMRLEYREFEITLLKEIKELPPRCRKVFLLSRLSNLSNSDISERLNISVRTVESHISTALRILRAKPVFQNY